MHINTIIQYHYAPIQLKRLTTSNVDEDLEPLELSDTASARSVKRYHYSAKSFNGHLTMSRL